MKLSTRSRYGLKAVVDIALGEGKSISIKSMSQRLDISENYLEQLIIKLKKAGILNSVRGAGGGYSLAEPPENISVGRILNILEGSLYPAACLDEDDKTCGDGICNPCVTKGVWGKIYESVTLVVESITVMDLLNEHKKLYGDDDNA